jgi:hypothetical protein
MSSFGNARNHSASFLNGGRGNVLLVLATAQPQHQHQHHSLMPPPGSTNARQFLTPSVLCASGAKTLSEQLAEMRSSQTRELGMFGAWRALKQWSDEECTRIEAAGRSRDDQDKKAEPFEIPSLRTLRQT